MSDVIDAVDLDAMVNSHGVSIELKGTRSAELTIEGPQESQKVSSGETYRLVVSGRDGSVTTETTFHVDAQVLEEAVDNV